MLEISYACSLGNWCHSSNLLKRNKYKKCSYPFDWIFSNCDNIIHCIEDGFQIFLDKQYYIDKPLSNSGESRCGHSKYDNGDKGDKGMFNHYNPLTNVDHYNYYIRCVDRFKDLLQKQEHKLFTMIFINNYEDINVIMNNVTDFNTKFSKYTSNYTLLILLHIPNKEKNHHIFTYNDNIHFLELHTLSVSNGLKFRNEDDNVYLDNIMKLNYKIDEV